MISRKPVPKLKTKYIMPSIHGYMFERLKDDPKWTWSHLDNEEKTSLLGLMWIAYLDRLQHAEFDVQPVMDSLEQLVQAIDAKAVELQREHPIWASLIKHLNRLNRRQLELMELNDKDNDSELMHLSQEMLNRIAMIHDVLLYSNTEREEIGISFSKLLDALKQMADRLDELALRHFHAEFKRGNIESLAAVCMGGGFLRAVAGAMEYRLTGAAYWDFAQRYYDLGALISLGEHFDFRSFDDDTNTLLPEVVDLLYGGGDGNDG